MIDEREATIRAARQTLDQLRVELLAMRQSGGHWVGELSASALSTATAISALAAVCQAADYDQTIIERSEIERLISRGIAYLDTQQNRDGGYGDTDRSHSNIATSYLVLAARRLAALTTAPPALTEPAEAIPSATQHAYGLDRLRQYIQTAGEIEGLRKRYGKDKTFVVPILTNLAIAGLADWKDIPRLPFEAAVFPGAMYRFLQMPVVSYAIPALVAIGQAHHFCGPPALWPIHRVRAAAVRPTMKVLQRMQPDSGGYLEATPLTSFVLMSLAATGRSSHPVSLRCIEFLRASIRADGSWPIDTNLATWVTSLAIGALGEDPQDDRQWVTNGLIQWHLSCQHATRHPFTGADPGGWGWTDLSGAVPDGDDTPAAILAIRQLARSPCNEQLSKRFREATIKGLNWLVDLQNRDGGVPTFCRGWGKLPFDRNSTDLTAHLIRAVDAAQQGVLAEFSTVDGPTSLAPLFQKWEKSRRRAIAFLSRQQRGNGRWVPLWFGNQDDGEEENPVYGTGRVLLAIAREKSLVAQRDRAVDYLIGNQNGDGGWGGGESRSAWLRRSAERLKGQPNAAEINTGVGPKRPEAQGGGGRSGVYASSSVEETAVAVEALAAVLRAGVESDENGSSPRDCRCEEAIIGGVRFLVDAVTWDHHREPWPIGFYFAKLWYHEQLYPIVLTMAALGSTLRYWEQRFGQQQRLELQPVQTIRSKTV